MKFSSTRLFRSIALLLAALLFEMPFALHAQAGMIETSDAVSALARVHNREKVEAFLQRNEVQGELMRYGVSSEEASQRIASLSDAELEQLAGQVENAPAGGDAIVISLTTVLLVIILLLLLRRI